MTRTARPRNTALLAAIRACGWSYESCAAAVRAVAREHNDDLSSCGRSHVAHWVAGVQPSGMTPYYLAEAISRRVGHVTELADLGLAKAGTVEVRWSGPDWRRHPAIDLVTLGRADLERREFALTALYSLAALTLPLEQWQEIVERGQQAYDRGASVGRGEVDAVRDMTAAFSRADERFGGGHARLAVVQYLTTDVAAYLRGAFTSDDERRAMFSAAAELAYLAGWKAFDSSLHGLAQRYYLQSLRLANEADDRALASFTLRALAHQAVDLGHGLQTLQLADSALAWSRGRSTPAATALFTILTARGHAATGDRTRTMSAIEAAERSLAQTSPDNEPGWIQTSGFTATSLASQAGQALRDLGDLASAEEQLRRSVGSRDGDSYRRIHSLTLANLADVQCSRGQLPAAVQSWHQALDAMAGVKSGRAETAVRNIRRRMGSLGNRAPTTAKRLDRRASQFLRNVVTQ